MKTLTMTKKWYAGTPEEKGMYWCAIFNDRFKKGGMTITAFENLTWSDFGDEGNPKWMRYYGCSDKSKNIFVPFEEDSGCSVVAWTPYVEMLQAWTDSNFVEEIEK